MDNRPCGVRKNAKNNAYSKYELVSMAIAMGGFGKTESKLYSLTLNELCKLVGLSKDFPVEEVSANPDKPCGPLRGANRYSKPELISLAVKKTNRPEREFTKLTINELCKELWPDKYGLREKKEQINKVESGQKLCGPRSGKNRYTKTELI